MEEAIQAGELGAAVPLIDLDANGEDAPVIVTVPQNRGEHKLTVIRPVTPNDIPKLANLGLASFAVDFSAVEKPKAGELDEVALHAYADNLCKQAGINV